LRARELCGAGGAEGEGPDAGLNPRTLR